MLNWSLRTPDHKQEAIFPVNQPMRVFENVIVIAFQNAFHSEKCVNNIFFIF